MLASKSATLWRPARHPITSTTQLQRLCLFLLNSFYLYLLAHPALSTCIWPSMLRAALFWLVISAHISTTRRVAQDLEGLEQSGHRESSLKEYRNTIILQTKKKKERENIFTGLWGTQKGGDINLSIITFSVNLLLGFPGGTVIKNLPANTEDTGLTLVRKNSWRKKWLPTGGGQHSGLGNHMDRGAWQATVHRVAKESYTTKQLSTHECTQIHLC